MTQYNLLTLLNLDPWVNIFLIFCVTKWEVYIKHFCFILKYEGYHEVELWAELLAFCIEYHFSLKEPLIHNHTHLWLFRFVYSTDLSLKMSIQENKLLYLLPRIKLEISGKNLHFWKLVSTLSLKTSQFLKIFLTSSMVIQR